jgi:hypothetical protein
VGTKMLHVMKIIRFEVSIFEGWRNKSGWGLKWCSAGCVDVCGVSDDRCVCLASLWASSRLSHVLRLVLILDVFANDW